jgi:hypothetical protein
MNSYAQVVGVIKGMASYMVFFINDMHLVAFISQFSGHHST